MSITPGSNTCFKCWNDALERYNIAPGRSRWLHYQDLMQERLENPCTIEERCPPK